MTPLILHLRRNAAKGAAIVLAALSAGLLAVVIALLTIGGNAVKAAMANPAESLRSE